MGRGTAPSPASPSYSQTMAEWHTDVIRALINVLDEICCSLRLAWRREGKGAVRWGGSQKGGPRPVGAAPTPSPRSSHIFFGCSGSPSTVCPIACTAPLRSAPCGLVCLSCPPLCTPISGGAGRDKLLKAAWGNTTLLAAGPPRVPPTARLCPSPTLSSHLLCDKFVDILVLRQEFLPAQAPVPPQLACSLLALQARQTVNTSTPCPPSPGRGIPQLDHATPMTQTQQGMPPADPSGGRGAQSPHGKLPPQTGCQSWRQQSAATQAPCTYHALA